MCTEHESTWTDPRTPAALSRRKFLTVSGAAGATYLFSSALGTPAAAAGRGKRRVYVLVVDGCRPDEITPDLTPNLAALRDGGRNHPRARSMPIMETIPNHVMMMTGVLPRRSGVPANAVYDRAEGEVRDLDRKKDLRFPTVIQRLNRAGYTTGTVLSKEYLYGIFGDRATHRWEPAPIVPVSGHAPDVFTMNATIAMVEEFDPNLVFVNLGDIDRMGHVDLTGGSVQALRRAALVSTDLQVGRFVDLLKSSGRWRNSVVMVLADHSMDWSLPHRIINLQPKLDADPLLAGNVAIADNGGADLLYWTGPKASRKQARKRMRAIASATEGVLSVHRPKQLDLGPEAGDLVVYCRAGWRFSDPGCLRQPDPRQPRPPGDPADPVLHRGRLPPRRQGDSPRARSRRTLDVAPTVGRVFGLPAPRGGYDGRARL